MARGVTGRGHSAGAESATSRALQVCGLNAFQVPTGPHHPASSRQLLRWTVLGKPKKILHPASSWPLARAEWHSELEREWHSLSTPAHRAPVPGGVHTQSGCQSPLSVSPVTLSDIQLTTQAEHRGLPSQSKRTGRPQRVKLKVSVWRWKWSVLEQKALPVQKH